MGGRKWRNGDLEGLVIVLCEECCKKFIKGETRSALDHPPSAHAPGSARERCVHQRFKARQGTSVSRVKSTGRIFRSASPVRPIGPYHLPEVSRRHPAKSFAGASSPYVRTHNFKED